MKRFILLRLSALLFGIGAALVLTPACKAQSEISPDHFDGTDTWATAARPLHAQPQKQTAAKPLVQTRSQKAAQGSAFELAAAREVAKPVRREAGAADRKRKPATANSEKQ